MRTPGGPIAYCRQTVALGDCGGSVVRRWHLIGLVALCLLALACKGADTAEPAPTGAPKPGLPSSMAALGDSITAGIGTDACFPPVFTPAKCNRNSWATGNVAAVNSHYWRIRTGNSKMIGHAKNFAEPGAQASNLAHQADQAVRAKVQYVTILIGANDACAATVKKMTSIEVFRAQIDDGLATLKRGLPKARVLVASIPDLYRLWQLGHTNRFARFAWRLAECPSLLDRPTSTTEADDKRRRQVADRVDAYNTELAAACEAYGSRCRWDGGKAHRVRFSLDLVNNVDYFHPNAAGQRALAAATYPRRFSW
jgi:lysophospholipase L1-like esterase